MCSTPRKGAISRRTTTRRHFFTDKPIGIFQSRHPPSNTIDGRTQPHSHVVPLSEHQPHCLRRPEIQKPPGLQALQRGGSGRGQVDARSPAVLGRLLAHDVWAGFRYVWRPDRRAALGYGQDRNRPGQGARARVFRIYGEAGRSVLRLPRSRRGPARADLARIEPVVRHHRRPAQGAAAAHRHQAALGHFAAFCPHPLRAGRGDQSEHRVLASPRRRSKRDWKLRKNLVAKVSPSGAAAKDTRRFGIPT